MKTKSSTLRIECGKYFRLKRKKKMKQKNNQHRKTDEKMIYVVYMCEK